MKIIQNIDYLATINLEESVHTYLDQIVKRFEEGTIKLEKLQNRKNMFSFRLNRQKRVICTFGDKQGQAILIICEILETHQYHRCKYLLHDINLSNYGIVGIAKSVSNGSADKTYLQLSRIARAQFGNKTILLSNQQLEVIEKHTNNSVFIVVGAAGSGKTTLAQLIISEKSTENKVLYLTKSRKLLSAVKKEYEAINTAVGIPCRAEFKSYESLSSRIIFQKLFEEDNFKNYKKYLSENKKTTANNQINDPTYEAVQAILQKDKTIFQSDIEYNQLNQYIDSKLYHKVRFSEWLKSQKLYNKIKKEHALIREIYEDIRKLHDAQYCQDNVIGKKTCANHPMSNEILDSYKDFLRKTGSIDFTLMDVQTDSQSEDLYDYIVVDEAQDFGKSELQYILSFLNKNGNLYFFIDANQSLLDDFNLTFHYIKELSNQFKKIYYNYQLTDGYRTPKNITRLANNILTVKRSILDGSLSKNAQSAIQLIDDNVSEGDVRFLDTTESQQSIAHLQAESKISINIVILVPDDSMRIAAEQLFPQGIILTPEEIKGLEFDKIVLVNFLNKSSVNQLTSEQLQSITPHQHNHFPKKLDLSILKHNLFFTKLFVSVTRSMHSVYFIQTKKDNVSAELKRLFEEKIDCGTEIKLDTSSIEAIMEFITEKKDSFSLKQLLDYCQIAYNRIDASELDDGTCTQLNALQAILKAIIVDIEEEPQQSRLTDLQQKVDGLLCQRNASQPDSVSHPLTNHQNWAHPCSPVADGQQPPENSNFHWETPPLNPIKERLSLTPPKWKLSKARKIASTKDATASASQSILQQPSIEQTGLQQRDEQLSLETLQSTTFNINNITSSQLEQIVEDKTVLCFLLDKRKNLITNLKNKDLIDFTNKITSQALNTPSQQGESALYQLTRCSENISIFKNMINCSENIINKISQASIPRIGPSGWSPLFYLHLHNQGKFLNKNAKLKKKFQLKAPLEEPLKRELDNILPKFIDQVSKTYKSKILVENLIYPAFITAAQLGLDKMVGYLIRQGGDVNTISQEGHSVLMMAAVYNHKDFVMALVEAGASVHLKNKHNGISALHAAVSIPENQEARLFKNSEIISIRNTIVEYLIEQEADVNCTDNMGASALLVAAKNTGITVVKTLVEAGALVNWSNNAGVTALHYAVMNNQAEIVAFLLKHQADPNVKTTVKSNIIEKQGCVSWLSENMVRQLDHTTPLHLAIEDKFTDVIQMLIDAGADLSIKDGNGKTVFDIAKRSGNTEIADILREAEALKISSNESNPNQKANGLSQAMSYSAEQPFLNGLEPQPNKETDRLFHHGESWISGSLDTHGP